MESLLSAGLFAAFSAIAGAAGGYILAGRVESAAKGQSVAAAEPGTVTDIPPPVSAIEIHMVLNVLNRLSITTAHDEHAQDGVAALASYFSALALMNRVPLPADLGMVAAPLEAYRRLSEWQFGVRKATFSLTCYGTISGATAADRIVDAAQALLRQLEGEEIDDIRLAVVISDDAERPPGRAHAIVEMTIKTPSTRTPSTPWSERGWRGMTHGRWILQRQVPL